MPGLGYISTITAMATPTPTPAELKAMIEDIGPTIDPDGDWIPCLHVYTDQGAALIALLMMENDQTKDLCAKIMYNIIRRTNPNAVAFVSTAWQGDPDSHATMDREDFLEAYRKGWIPRPSQDPDRVEIVMVLLVEKNHNCTMLFGEIERSPDQPPKIKEWREMTDTNAGDGRFGEAIMNGFRDADPNGSLSVLEELKKEQ
jgi:hypothetical protein